MYFIFFNLKPNFYLYIYDIGYYVIIHLLIYTGLLLLFLYNIFKYLYIFIC